MMRYLALLILVLTTADCALLLFPWQIAKGNDQRNSAKFSGKEMLLGNVLNADPGYGPRNQDFSSAIENELEQQGSNLYLDKPSK